MQDQYLELNTAVQADSSIFGAEERTASKGLGLQRSNTPLPLWNHDTLSAVADTNLYGSHPFVLEVRPGTLLLCLLPQSMLFDPKQNLLPQQILF